MDSKRTRNVLTAMIVLFAAVLAVITVANLDAVKQKLGLARKTPVQEEVQENSGEEETKGGQIGGNLSAFLSDETF